MTPDELETALRNALGDPNATDWGLYVTWIIAISAVVVAYLQLSRISDQIRATNIALEHDHERSRRERTIEVIKYHQQGVKPEHNKIMHFLDRLPDESLINLRDAKPITIGGDLKEIACSILQSQYPDVYERYCGLDGSKKSIDMQLTHSECMQLRFLMIDIVNHIETCLVPWHLGIVDSETIEEQFPPLVDKRDGKFKLQSARNIIGVEKFPATEAFRSKLFDETPKNKRDEIAKAS